MVYALCFYGCGEKMNSIDTQIAKLKDRIEAARIAKARAEAAHQIALETKEEAEARLKAEFSLDSLTDARARLEELQQKLETDLRSAELMLDELES
jgi:hypothetical protein